MPESRPQVVLFNLATTLTVASGVPVLYLAQFVMLVAAALNPLTPSVLGAGLRHHAELWDDLKVVWLAASLATTGAPSARRSSPTALSARPRTPTARQGWGDDRTDPMVLRRARTVLRPLPGHESST